MCDAGKPASEVTTARPVAYRPPPLVALGVRVRPRRARLIGLVVLAGTVGLLVVAGRLDPDPSGSGTHEQLGLPACSMMVSTGKPCPTCGMTTAFAYMVRGRVLRALAVQPFGAILCVVVMVAAVASLVVVVTGRGWQVDWYRATPDRILWAAVILFLAAWGYKAWLAG